jgi:ankyrin repeat protein
MLDAGVDPDGGPDRHLTPLMVAAEAGQLQVVRLLLTRGADPDAREPDGRTALDLARAAGHRQVIALLQRAPVGE